MIDAKEAKLGLAKHPWGMAMGYMFGSPIGGAFSPSCPRISRAAGGCQWMATEAING